MRRGGTGTRGRYPTRLAASRAGPGGGRTLREGLRRWLPVVLWAGLILALGQGAFSAYATGSRIVPLLQFLGLSKQTAVRVHLSMRKGAHVGEYAVLGGLADRALAPGVGPPAAVGAAAIALVVAGLDESLQARTRERTGSPRDVALDVVGAGLGIAAARRLRRPRRRD